MGSLGNRLLTWPARFGSPPLTLRPRPKRREPRRAGVFPASGRASPLLFTVLACVALAPSIALAQPAVEALAKFAITGDTIAQPLGGAKGDAARGKTLAFDPERGNCTICHPVPGGDARAQGDVGPTLAGVGARLTEGQLRLRVVDGTRINPDTIMPPYHRVEGLNRVGPRWQGKPVLSAQEVEDIVAFLGTLRQ